FINGHVAFVNLLNPFVVGQPRFVGIKIVFPLALLPHGGPTVGAFSPGPGVLQIGRLVGPGTIDILGDWRLVAGELALVTIGGSRRAVDRTVAKPQIPRLVGVTMFALDII